MKKILIYSILLFALCSCDNFLEEDPRGKLTPSSFFSSPEDLDMAITGMYNKYYQTNARVFRAIYVWCADDVTVRLPIAPQSLTIKPSNPHSSRRILCNNSLLLATGTPR